MSDTLLWNEIGNIYLKIGSPEDAIAAYAKAIEMDPDSGWPYCNLGHAYFLTGEFGQALFLFRKSIQLMDTPENQSVVWNKIGDAYRALKDVDNAILAYKKADDLDMGTSSSDKNGKSKPDNLTNLREMLKTEKIGPITNSSSTVPSKKVAFNDPSSEKQTLVDGLQPDNIDKIYGENPLPSDETETKSPVSTNRTEIEDQDIRPLVENPLGGSRFVRNADKAPLPNEKSIIVIPNLNETVEDLPNERPSLTEPEQISNSDPALKQNENLDGKAKGGPNTYPGIDDLEETLAKVNIYENITRVNPTSDRAWDTLGKLYKSLGRYKDAICAYQKAIDIAPEREVYYYYLGLLYSVEQQHDDAVRAFLFVLSKNPDYVLAHSALAGVYHRMGLENKANHHIATALPKMNNESAYNRACFYAICGDIELAFEFLRLALINKDTTVEWIKSDPDLDPIRTDRRFQGLISEKDQTVPENTNENYFSSELEGTQNRLLPILNHSLAR